MNQNSILIDCHQDIAYSVRANRRLFEENIDNLLDIEEEGDCAENDFKFSFE